MARAAQQEQTLGHSVALNVAPMIAPYRKHGRLSLRIERAPQNARLSHGTRNNDGTWSLASDELDNLFLQMPEAPKKDLKLGVRIIGLIDGSTLASLDLAIAQGAQTAGGGNTPAPFIPTSSELAELNALRHELAAAKEALSQRNAEMAEGLAAAATEATAQFQQTLAKAEAAWTANENTRLAAIQEQWQEKFAEALAELETSQHQAHEGQLRELQDQLETLKATLAERELALKEAKSANSVARERGDSATQEAQSKLAETQAKLAAREAELARVADAVDAAKREAEAALTKAEQAWRDGEAARLTAAEAEWREASAKALAEAHADADALRAKGSAGESDLLNRVAELQAAIAERDEALARTQSAHEQARARTAQEADARLAKAEENWKAAQTARLAAVEAEWRTKLDQAVKAARAEAPAVAAPTPSNNAETEALQEKIAALQAKLSLRDAAAARAAKLAEEERRRWQKEAQDVIVKAGRERKADEATRLSAAQAEWNKQYVRELAIVTARAEAAEAALTQMRLRATEEAPLQKELASARSALAIREAEVEHLRAQLPPEDDGNAAQGLAPVTQPTKRGRNTLRDVLVAAVIGVALVTFWPQISAMMAPPPPPPPAPAPVAAEVPAVLPVVTAIKDAKLRATPSMFGDVTGKLKRDVKVEVVETKGEWSKVRRMGELAKGEVAEGWAKSSLFEEVVEAPAEPAKKR